MIMFRSSCSVFLVFIFTTPIFTAVIENTFNICSPDEFSCGDGSCVALSAVCDGRADCAGQHDERGCHGDWNRQYKPDLIRKRVKRQKETCGQDQWKCHIDGTCIAFDKTCDGVVDCPDKTDETIPLCRYFTCQSDKFRCKYGACVAGTAPCNGIKECADNSDELLPQCGNQTQILTTERVYRVEPTTTRTTTSTTTTTTPPPPTPPPTTTTTTARNEERPIQAGNCKLPPYPTYGMYSVSNVPNAVPGQSYTSVLLQISCYTGFGVEDSREIIWCFDGVWSNAMPRCVSFCRLNKHPSVEYRCLSTGYVTGSRECSSLEPPGTIVQPICRSPNYYYSGILPNMHCFDGSWDYIAQCKPECGTITPEAKLLVLGGQSAKKGELPWHAGIYSKMYEPYMQVCGGSLISTRVVISAAHCFWSEFEKLPEANYAVAVGKLYRPWNNAQDEQAQMSDIAKIRFPSRYHGSSANYQDDIAVVIVVTPFTYMPYIRPVCIDFDVNFDRQQMQPGTLGKVAGWGFTTPNGMSSPILKVVDMPMVSIGECRALSPDSFRVYLTSDKICAGYTNGTTLCQGDSGGGLAFPAVELATQRYYLRGVVSVSPTSDDACTTGTLVAFTQLIKHEHFIKESL